MNKRKLSIKRAKEVKSHIEDFLSVKDTIPFGLNENVQDQYCESKKILLTHYNATDDDWNNYIWQLDNRITDIETLSLIVKLTNEEKKELKKVNDKYRLGISPYYASLIDRNNAYDPIRLLSVPLEMELNDENGELDPMNEELTNPAGAITRRYPDRLLINITNQCAMYCRFCQRRRHIGQVDKPSAKLKLVESIEYIKKNKEIRDVLLTGGDALLVSDDRLKFILDELRNISHVEIIRIGTRTPVTMPQRITSSLINILKKYHPIYINIHFNHPKEITPEAKEACEKLANAGFPLSNHSVLLNGINNNKYVMRLLNQKLLSIRVKPYYMFHAKNVKGTTHFNTSVDDGLKIIEYLRGYTSGLAVPTYVINAPNGLGKVPISPLYLLSKDEKQVKIRTWEGKILEYQNTPTFVLSEKQP